MTSFTDYGPKALRLPPPSGPATGSCNGLHPKFLAVFTTRHHRPPYWSQKIYLEQKDEWRSANYFARIQARGVRKKVRLESTIREEAAREAATFYRNIVANGWPVEESFSGAVSKATGLPKNPTLEEWLSMARRKATVRPGSVEKYGESLRTIVREILGMRGARKKEDRVRINNFHISELTKGKLQAWLDARIQQARGLDMVKAPRAQNTIRALIANAKGLFSRHILEAIEIEGGGLSLVPFQGLKLPSKVLPKF